MIAAKRHRIIIGRRLGFLGQDPHHPALTRRRGTQFAASAVRTCDLASHSRQLHPQRLGHAVGEIGNAYRHGKLHQLAVAEMLLQPADERIVNVDMPRDLLGIANDVALQFAIRIASLVIRRFGDLPVAEASLFPDRVVMMQAIVTSVELRGLDVGQLAELAVETGLGQRRVEAQERLEAFRDNAPAPGRYWARAPIFFSIPSKTGLIWSVASSFET